VHQILVTIRLSLSFLIQPATTSTTVSNVATASLVDSLSWSTATYNFLGVLCPFMDSIRIALFPHQKHCYVPLSSSNYIQFHVDSIIVPPSSPPLHDVPLASLDLSAFAPHCPSSLLARRLPWQQRTLCTVPNPPHCFRHCILH
jgi:hypothetical protein